MDDIFELILKAIASLFLYTLGLIGLLPLCLVLWLFSNKKQTVGQIWDGYKYASGGVGIFIITILVFLYS